jgi:hypothetical protein
VNSDLTLNYGLRWEAELPRREVDNKMNSFDPISNTIGDTSALGFSTSASYVVAQADLQSAFRLRDGFPATGRAALNSAFGAVPLGQRRVHVWRAIYGNHHCKYHECVPGRNAAAERFA